MGQYEVEDSIFNWGLVHPIAETIICVIFVFGTFVFAPFMFLSIWEDTQGWKKLWAFPAAIGALAFNIFLWWLGFQIFG